jgi:LysM repeat protein
MRTSPESTRTTQLQAKQPTSLGTSRDEGARLLARREADRRARQSSAAHSNAERIEQMKAATRTIEVEPGGSLWALAEKHLGDGGRWMELAEANGLASPYRLEVGQQLELPAGDVAPSSPGPDEQVVASVQESTPAVEDVRAPALDEGDRLLRRGLAEVQTPLSGSLPVSRGGAASASRLVQERLVAHGAQIEVDGAFGVQTEDMVRAFQFANRIAVTGVVDQLTAAMLFDSSARGIDAARIPDVPGIAIGEFETWDSGKLTGTTDVVLLDGARLAAWLVPHWVEMRDAAAADGVTLRFNSRVSGFRTPEDQAALHRRYGLPRAVPAGWSNHQDGEAIDLVMSADVKRWMADRAGEFGFVRPTYEEWHWEYRP